mmetsp:Transcript_12107/g.21499  ORF Transcript_12107/g.21499 Transcript_12107/m.21499 type:complete len:93 (+) Transcript_12107:32-310(+)
MIHFFTQLKAALCLLQSDLGIPMWITTCSHSLSLACQADLHSSRRLTERRVKLQKGILDTGTFRKQVCLLAEHHEACVIELVEERIYDLAEV